MKAFTYCLYHKPTGKKYYGVRFKKGCQTSDLWNKYFSSSQDVKKLIEEYGLDSFRFEIRKLFDCTNKAREWEHKVLRRLKVLRKPEWLNRTLGKAPSTKGFKYSKTSLAKMSKSQSGPNNPMFGKTHTAEARLKISQAGTGRVISKETRLKLSLAHKKLKMHDSVRKASWSEAARKKRSLAMTGQVRTLETREKMRKRVIGKKWFTDGINEVMVHVNVIPQGFVAGRLRPRSEGTY